MPAHGTVVLHRHIPGHEIAPGAFVGGVEPLTAVIGILLAGLFADAGALHEPPAALGAAARHLHHQGLGEGALRISGTGQEPAEPAGLDYHIAAAYVALLLGDLVGDLQIYALHVLLHLLEIALETAVKLPQQLLPGDLAAFHLIQLVLHPGGELHVHNVREALAHQVRHHLAQGRDPQGLALLHHIFPVQNGGHGGGVGRGAADAVFLHGADQGGVGVAGGGLGEVLAGLKALQRHHLAGLQVRQGGLLFLLIVVAALLIHGGIAGKFQAAGAGAEGVLSGGNVHADAVVHGVCHLTGQEAAPDQPVQAILLAGQVALHLLRGQGDAAGPDGLVGVLRPGLGLVLLGGLRAVGRAVAALDEAARRCLGLVGDTQGVGTHIGDQTHGALAADVHALIQLLGDGHGPAGGHVQLPGGLLLHGGGGEGGRRGPPLIRPLYVGHGEGRVLQLGADLVHLLLRGGLIFLAAAAIVVGLEPGPLVILQQGVQGPVLLGHEISDLLFPVRHQAHGHGLHPPGGQAPADLFPQQGRELIAHDAVQDAAGLLSVHQVLVNVPGLADALGDHLAGDLVEGDPEGFILRQVQQLLQVPADGLSLAVWVGGQVNGVAVLGRLLQVPDDVLLALDGPVIGFKVVVHVHAQLAFGQVPQMSHTGLHLIRGAQIFADGLGLGRGLHDHQVFFSLFCHIYDPSFSECSLTVRT